MTHVKLSEARTSDTPVATMSTYASPTTTPAAKLAVWRTQMPAGTAGPLHVVDVEHVVVVLEGTLVAEVDGARHEVATRDGVILPAGSERRLCAGTDEPLVTLTAATPGSSAQVAGASPVPVPWAR